MDGSGAKTPTKVTNISYGGCRLLIQTPKPLPIAAAVSVKIQTGTDQFEATAKVVHSTTTDMGLMFGDIAPKSLFVLQKWINQAKSATTAPQP